MDLTQSEENHIKEIYSLGDDVHMVSTNALSDALQTKPASVSDMIKRLSQKKLVYYIKYKGVSLTEIGKTVALRIIRKHRLWEVFLVENLGFEWDEVHDVAEQLEHIKSPQLIERLDSFLGLPTHDPHGDPIPNAQGEFASNIKVTLSELPVNGEGLVVGVNDDDPALLRYLHKIGISLGAKILIRERIEYDGSIELTIDKGESRLLSKEIANNIFVKK